MASYVLRSLMNTQLQRTYIYMKKESGRLKLNNSSLNQTSSFRVLNRISKFCWKHAMAQKNSFLMILPFAIPFIFTFFIVPFCSFFVSLKYYPEFYATLCQNIRCVCQNIIEYINMFKKNVFVYYIRYIKFSLDMFLSHSYKYQIT